MAMTELEFEATLDGIVTLMQELFERDLVIIHVSFLILGDGSHVMVPFADFEQQAHDKGVDDGDDRKRIVFDYIALKAKEMKAVGYVDISEAWMLSPPEDSAEPPGEFYRRIGPIRENPGRLEVVVVHGSFGRTAYMKAWKICRRGKEAWLLPHLDSKTEIDPKNEKELAGTNMGRIDLEIMKNAVVMN